MNEGRQQQRHYLYTEAQCIGADSAKSHGPNNVISMLHHYLESTVNSPTLHLRCDKCVGQNKNKSVMAYLAWRILVGKEESITVSFMVVGHTRCAVDGGFGLAKKKFRASDTDTYDQLASLVSASEAPNESCKDPEEKGVVTMKGTCREEEPSVKVRILKDTSDEHTFSAEALPPILPPGGMSAARREYLEKNVLAFCRPENRVMHLRIYFTGDGRGGMPAARRECLEKNVLEFCRPENRDAFKDLLH